MSEVSVPEKKTPVRLTPTQKADIFKAALEGARTCDLCRKYNVSSHVIQSIKYDKRRLAEAEDKLNSRQRFNRLMINSAAEKGIRKEHEILDADDRKLVWLQHQVATSMINTAGYKAPDKNEGELKITFGGDDDLEPGMPEERDEAEDMDADGEE